MNKQATMICVDNSEWMRNGDYSPSRFQAQADAINLICGAKTQVKDSIFFTKPCQSGKHSWGVDNGGKGVRVLATPTSDLGRILACMHGIGNDREEIEEEQCALDIVDFGEEDDGKPEKLEALLSAVNNNDSSHLVHVPPGPDALSDVLISTPVFTGDGEGGSGFAVAAAAATAAAIGGSSGYDFDVDPNIDPELALALRVSMEEERARQEAAAKRSADEASSRQGEEPPSKSEDVTMTESGSAMSMNMSGSGNSAGDAEMSEATSADQELALASRSDPNDPSVKELLASLKNQSQERMKRVHQRRTNEDVTPCVLKP
ncbi:putative 26S proteasome regulatory complex, non-ATPase subcomplex, subunit s5a [Rosa chinensis]|uniref:Putative 26S proteasome regulatory complex, non-ATPase subcomplex, subunit s5a n=1 Tax=Rosa chinensis TaxID=74649 RepID=A0A2P6PL23_ROSCH|nr:putative 26S proteasome regulatory complex, non-ATPase subcomplex, subunit s5a [Rosa chinensis]